MLRYLRKAIGAHRRTWFATLLLFPLSLYGGQLLLLMLRFKALPNYVTTYDWPSNIARIIRSTHSIRDIVAIGSNEWLLEIGHMNYDYGKGIADWSFELLPANMLFVLFLAALVATNLAVIRYQEKECQRERVVLGAVTTCTAGLFGAITSVTVTWITCCGIPSWITGLSVFGVGLSTAQSLKPLGPFITGAAISVLAATLLSISWMPAKAMYGRPGLLD
jgi:hypothetical protein